MRKWIAAVLVAMAGTVLAQQRPTMPLPELEAAATTGDAQAQYDLGRRLYGGTGGATRDPKAALSWLERSAGQGNVEAHAILGVLYKSGLGIPKDLTRARQHLEQAAAAGHAMSMVFLGSMDAEGQGIAAPDPAAAEKHFREALAKGENEAAVQLAALLMGSAAQPGPAPAEGLAVLRRAALAGHGRSAHGLFLIYANGQNNIARDEKEAARWLAVAAKAGVPESQVAMAMALREGKFGLGREPREAYLWISLAAQKMNPMALMVRDSFEKELTPNEIADVQQQLRNWKPTVLADTKAGRVPLAGLKIDRTYSSQQITRENFAAVVRECLPAFSDQALDRTVRSWDFPRRNATTLMTEPKDAATFAVYESTAICVRESDNGFPVLAGESFIGTIEPVGVPEALRDDWFATIALLIARKGYAEVVYRFPNGNGFTTLYRPTPTGLKIEYRASFRKAGEYDPGKYDAVFTSPDMKSVSTNSYGQRQEKFVLMHRFRPMPAAAGLPTSGGLRGGLPPPGPFAPN